MLDETMTINLLLFYLLLVGCLAIGVIIGIVGIVIKCRDELRKPDEQKESEK